MPVHEDVMFRAPKVPGKVPLSPPLVAFVFFCSQFWLIELDDSDRVVLAHKRSESGIC